MSSALDDREDVLLADDEVIGIVDARNVSAIALLQRVGFTLQRTDTGEFKGAPCEEHVFALTLGPFAPPLERVPAWRLPVPTNLSIKRAVLPSTPPPTSSVS